MQDATVRMLTGGVPMNSGVMTNLQRQATGGAAPVLGGPDFSQLC